MHAKNFEHMWDVLGYEVDKPSKILIKILKIAKYIESNIQNTKAPRKIILSSNMYEKTYLKVQLKEFLKLLKCLASSDMHTITQYLGLLFKALHQESKRRKERILTRLVWGVDMVVLLCSFKTNRKFAQKNHIGPCSLFCSFCVRKLEQLFAQFAQFAHNLHNPNKILTVYKIRTNSHNWNKIRTIRTKFAHSVEFEQIHINSHKITIINLYLAYISDIYVYYNIHICSYYIPIIYMFLLYSFVLIIYV